MISAIEFKAGITLDDSGLASESTFTDGSLVRGRRGRMQTIGGWESVSSTALDSAVRGIHAWAALTGDRLVAMGTATSLYTLYGGSLTNVTPYKQRETLVDPFVTVSGSATVTVTDLEHGLKDGDLVTYSLADSVGGLDLNGAHEITVLTIDQYRIEASSNASSTATGGGSVEVVTPLDDGLIDGIGGRGFGTGAFGQGAYGLPSGGDINPRTWSLDNFGQKLLANPRDGALYAWQPSDSYLELLTSGDFASADAWSEGAGWSISGGAATASAGAESELTQPVIGKASGGLVYVVSIDVTVTAGSLQLAVQSTDIDANSDPISVAFGQPFAKTGVYSRRFAAPSLPNLLKLVKDASFAGSVNSVSLKLESEAYRITAAPQYSTCMFVDPNRIVVCCGTIEADGDYNPLLVRWSDQERDDVWLPDVDNVAGEYPLSRGSRIVGAVASRGQNLIFTDDALYVMRFNGVDGFRFDLVGTGCGLIGPNAVVEHQGVVYWLARNGQFYVFRGSAPQVIVSSVRRTTWDNLAPSQDDKVFAGVNAEFDEIWWFYPDKRDGNENGRYVAYNFVEDHWVPGVMGRTAWIGAGVYENPIAVEAGTNRIYFQERGSTADGSPLQWFLETGYFNIADGDKLFRVRRYIADFEDQIGNVLATLSFRQWARGSVMNAGSYDITPEKFVVPMRQLGREARIRWEAGTNSQYARWGVQRLDVVPTSARR